MQTISGSNVHVLQSILLIQVKLMSMTDILVSPHGAQLTNMFLMDRNSSVMEFFPKGWLKLAGVGQYVYQWIASWSGMRHQGAWRDPNGDKCPYPEDDRRCMSIFKSGKIGHNETYFGEWARNVLAEVKTRKVEEASKKTSSTGCACTQLNCNLKRISYSINLSIQVDSSTSGYNSSFVQNCIQNEITWGKKKKKKTFNSKVKIELFFHHSGFLFYGP